MTPSKVVKRLRINQNTGILTCSNEYEKISFGPHQSTFLKFFKFIFKLWTNMKGAISRKSSSSNSLQAARQTWSKVLHLELNFIAINIWPYHKDILMCLYIRLGHHRRLYKHIHKLHHEFQAPIALAATYAHPLEHIVVNLSPLFISAALSTSHLITLWVWFFWVTILTLVDHSGYHLPLLFSPQHHDYHHLK